MATVTLAAPGPIVQYGPMSATPSPTRSFVPLMTAVVVAALTALSGCATGKRLTVDPGAVFRLVDDTGSGFEPRGGRVDQTADAPSAGSVGVVTDERPKPGRQRQDEPLFVKLGDGDVTPDPATALQAELRRLAAGFTDQAPAAKGLLGRRIAVLECEVSFAAADVTQPRPGAAPVAGYQPPAVEAMGAGARSMGQAMLGGSDIEIRLVVTIDGARFTSIGRGRYTAHPGTTATVWPFRQAVGSIVTQFGATNTGLR